MRSRTAITLSITLLTAWVMTPMLQAQDVGWRPTRYQSRRVASYPLPTQSAPRVTLGAPIAKRRTVTRVEKQAAVATARVAQPTASGSPGWGRPKGVSQQWSARHFNRRPTNVPEHIDAPYQPSPTAIASTPPQATFRAQAPDSVPPPAVGGAVGPPPGVPNIDPLIGTDPYNSGAIPSWQQPGAVGGERGFGDRCYDYFIKPCNPNRSLFESDNLFSTFSSPITSPFLSEDPRSLTEVRPIFIYQDVPNNNPVFNGGDVIFFGLQGRVAINERFSIVLNKLGGINFNPDNQTTSGFGDDTGFAEIWLGPKVTFIRNSETNTLMAGGLTFQIPAGSADVAQDTGNLGLVPYVSFAQGFNLFDRGPINFMTSIGYAFSTDSTRSEYFFANFHLDYNILGKVFPTLEVNWTHYTANGGARPFGFEGGDLINFGSTNVDGDDLVSIAPGVRYKFSECAQIGAAIEFPVTGDDQFDDYRFTFDFILRY